MRNLVVAAVFCGSASLLFAGKTTVAQESSYTPATVWTITEVRTLPGQDENYLDWLDKNWKRTQELGMKEGVVVSYHVFRVNAARRGEADLILATEYKDYQTTAQQKALQKKVEALFAADPHKLDTQAGERKAMREILSATELQELHLN
jgi:hypothetical protein